MANYFTRFLKGAVEGATNPKGQQSNYAHATRLFIDNNFRLSPKTKFLFYVRFEINTKAARATDFTANHQNEVGLLVKATDLPKFNFDSLVKNQYNRKKIVYKNFNYEPITVTFRDDNHGIVNALWALYYGYYIADRQQSAAAFTATHNRRTGTSADYFRYGLDNNISLPFFNSISIYTMARRRYIGYTLINPKIKSWNHGGMDYSASEFNESMMTLDYENVYYTAGNVTYNNPKGFATLHYDAVPSPLSVAGGGVSTLLGPGGVLDGLESIFGDISKGNAFSSPGNFLGTAIASINTYKNLRGLSGDQLKAEAINVLSNPANITRAISTVGGLVGSVFPKSSAASNNQGTSATPKSFPAPPDIG